MGGLRRELGFGEMGVEAGGEQRGEGEEKTGSPPNFGRRTGGSRNVPKVAFWPPLSWLGTLALGIQVGK